MKIKGIILLLFASVFMLAVSAVWAQDVVSPDGKVGVRLGGENGATEVYSVDTGASYGNIAGGTGAQFSDDSQSVVINNAKIDSYGTISDYKIFCRH